MSATIEYRRQTSISKATPQLDSDVQTYISGLTTELTNPFLGYLNTFVVDLKDDLSISSLSEVFDVMYVLANQTSEAAIRNLVERDFDATIISSAVFTQYEGFETDGVADYLNTNYNPYTDATNFLLNDAGIGFYARADISTGSKGYDGIYDVSIDCAANHHATYPGIYARLNSSESNYKYDASFTDARGMTIVTRNGSTDGALVAYRNKTTASLTSSGSNASVRIPNIELYLLASNLNGTPEIYDDGAQVSFYFISKFISTTMRDAIYDNFQAFMTSLGKQV